MDKEQEKLMKKFYKYYPKDSIFYVAMIKSLNFWETEDFYHKTNKAKIFKRIYMSKERKTSLLKLCIDYYVGERTLFRYRNDFIEMYKYFVENLKGKSR